MKHPTQLTFAMAVDATPRRHAHEGDVVDRAEEMGSFLASLLSIVRYAEQV